jgi:hypothetical protein
MLSCPELPPSTNLTSSAQPVPSPMLAHFVAYALHRTRLVPCITFAALFLLQRLKNRFPAARGSSGHHLFISAFVVASKVIYDDTYSNKSWAVFSPSMFQLKETNQMEPEMCGYLKWRTSIIRNSSSSQRSCRHADMPMRRHANAPTHQRTDTPMHRHANAPTCQRADTPTRRHADMPTRPTRPTHMLMPSHRAQCTTYYNNYNIHFHLQ